MRSTNLIKRQATFIMVACLIFIYTMETKAQSESQNVPKDWQTHAEKTDYRETPRYTETIALQQKTRRCFAAYRIQNIRKKRRRKGFAAFNCCE